MAKQGEDHFARFGASLVASGIAEAITLPTDVAKTRLQVQQNAGRSGIKYTGMLDCLQKTAKAEGVGACWKGLGPALIRQCCYSSLALVLYEPIRNIFRREGEEQLSFWQRLLAGGTAGSLSITVFNWTEVLKTQLQTSSQGTTMREVIRRVYRTDGILGFWAGEDHLDWILGERNRVVVCLLVCLLTGLLGWKPNIARTFLVNAAELGTYDQAKAMLVPYVGDNAFAHLGASGLAGVASACTSTPADVVKTRLMNHAGGKQVYAGVINAFTTIVKDEGPSALYKGFVPICIRKIMWCSVFFVSYEKLRSTLNVAA